MISKRIVGLLLVTIVICFVSFNLFPNLTSGKMQDGNIELNSGLLNVEKLFNSRQLLSPSQTVSSKEIKIKNTGLNSIKMYEKFFFSLKQSGFSREELNNMLDSYFVKVHFFKNGEKLNVEGLSDNWINLTDFNGTFNDNKENEIGIVNPNDTISMILDVKLDEHAGNQYQGTTLQISFVAVGMFKIEGED